MPRYKVNGNTYNLPEEKVEAFLAKFPEAVLFEEEQEVGKQVDVAVEDAAVTSVPEPASESMELESVDTSLVSRPKRKSVRGQQRAKELERIENRQQQEAIKDAVEEVEISTTVFDELPDVEKIKLQDLAVDQIELDYKTKGIKEYEIKPEEINAKASEILKEKTQPSIARSYGAQAVRGFAGFAKGLSEFEETIKYSLLEAALDVFDPEYKGTVEEKQAIMGLVKAGGLRAPGSAQLPPSSDIGKFIEKLEPSIRKYETQTITEEIEKGNYLVAGERAVGAAIESLPSLVAAATGVGGLVLLGGSVSGGKFMEEFEADPEKSTGVLLANAGLTGVTEASFELVTRGILSKARLLKNTGADKAARDLIRGGSEKLITSLGLNTLKEGGSEAATKVTTLFLDQLTLGKDIDWEKEAYNIIDEGIVGSVMGSGTTFAGALANTDKAIVERAQMILTPSENKKQLIQSANNISKLYKDAKSADVEGVKLINEAIKAEEANIVNIKKETADALNSMTPAELKVYAGNQNELRKLQQQIQNPKTTESVRKLANKKFVEIRDENDVLFQESVQRRIQRGVDVVTKAAERLEGVTVQSFDTTQDVENFIKQQDPEADIKASQQQGFIIQDPTTGEQTIVINKEIANKEKAMNIAGHEFGHAILFKTVKDSPETAVNLGEALLSEINKIDAAQVKDSKFKSRLEQYSADPKSIKMEEAITLFSDALATGDIKFNENVFTKIGDQIRRVMQSLGVKVKFNTGRDVYNFIKDYNRSIEKGVIGKVQIKAAKEGVKGKLVKDAVKEAETIIKESRSEEASQEVQRIYEEQGVDGAFDIIEQFKPITNKIVDRRREAPGFNREDLTSEIEFGKRGILDLIREYDPESGVPLAAYINKFLPARAIEASNRILGEEFTEDVTEARGVAAEEVVTEVTEEARGPKKPTETTKFNRVVLEKLGVENKQQAEKQISDATKKAFEGQEITRFGQTKNVPKSVAEIYGKMFGVNPETIYDKKRNYSKKDAEGLTRIKQYLIDNAASDYARLPRTKDDFGKATFIPNNVMNALYTDGKLTGTLKDYIDLIREKPVKPIYRDRVGQTIRGLFNTSIRNRMVEDLIPVKAERARAGVKFSKNIDTNIEDNKFSQIYFAYERGETISDKDKQIVEDYIAKQALEESDKGKSALQFTKAMKASDLPSNLKEGTWTLSDKKFKEDPNALKEFDKQANNLSSQIPLTANIANKNRNIVLGLFAGHYNIVGSDMAKIGSDFKQGILSNLNTDESSVLSEETLNRWKKFPWDDLKSSYASENYTGLRKINESNSFKEQQAIARETFSTKQGKASLELYDLWNTTLQEWLYSSEPGSKEFNDKANYILKLKKSNASIGTTGERILAPPGYVFLPGKAINGTVKFEHLKSSSQQSGESALLVLQNKWKDEGKDNIKAYNGIWGLLDDFNIIDEQTGKVNDSSIFRFAENLELAKSIYSVDSNFTKTLYDDIVKKVGEKSVKQFESDQNKLFNANNDKLPITVKLSKSKTTPDVLETMESLDDKAKEANKNFFDSADLDKGFNDILEAKTGIASEKRYKRVKAEVAGASKGRFNFFIPPSAEDFVGLLYDTLSKGKLGDAQMAWYKENLLNPYGKAMNELSSARIALMNDYKQLKKQLGLVPKNLRKKVPGEPFTREQAVRVYIWDQQGMEVPGISESDLKDLTDYVNGDRELQVFANQLIAIQKGDEYAKPKEGWPSGTITTDLLEGLNTTKRAKYLEQWQSNVDIIFSEENLNKLEAAYGKGYRKALENMLSRMKSGRNRSFAGDSLTGRVTDWLTGSIGTIMFFNTRSALLQTISSINFVNFTDNNILAAGKAFANQKQFWSDFMTLMNSDFLKERRGGLRINVNEADIADMAKKGGVRGVINKLLEFGFTPTQIADSFAIASGGATFYRNRIKTLKKQGLSDADAEAQAFVDFREIAEESQQSSRPDRISMQQAGPLGRIILAFANTPAQYARLIKKAARDLKAGRGDAKTNISKIIYYGVAQNLLFNALQQAIFAFGFGDEEPEDEEKQEKYISIANGMLDSLLRGMGIGGAVLSVGKNSIKRIFDEMEKKQPKLEKVGYELTKISPPISAKLSRINQAARSYQWDKKEMQEKGWSLDNPAYLAGANVVSALTNIPVDRAIKKTNNVVQATSQDLETWERLALLGGWQDWEIGIDKETKTNKPQPRKTVKKKVIKKKVIK